MLAGLVGSCAVAQAQTIEVAAPQDVPVAESDRTFALVEVVTDRNETEQTQSIGWKPMPQPGAEVTVVTQATQSDEPKPAFVN